MSGFNRIRGSFTLILGFVILLGPCLLQAQTAEEKLKAEQIRKEMEHRLQEAQQERLVRVEEALARAREEMAAAQERHGEFDAARLEQMDRMLAEARIQAENAQQVIVQVRSRVRLGVSLNGNQGEEYDSRGALIQTVMEDTPAQEAGLEDGDIITHLNGQSLLTAIPGEADEGFDLDQSIPVQRLMALAQKLEAGDEVEVRYLRDGDPLTVAFEAAEIDDPSFSILRGELGEMDSPRVLRVGPEGSGTWTFKLPDDEEFGVYFRGLEELKELEGIDENFELYFRGLEELKELEGLKELEELKGWQEMELHLEDLNVDTPNFRFRAFPEGGGRAFAFRGGDAPFVYNVMRGGAAFGLELTEMNPGLAEYFSTSGGLLVLNIQEESSLGLMPGDVIRSIDGRDVEDQGDVGRILRSYEDGETVSFTVFRKGRETQVEGTIR